MRVVINARISCIFILSMDGVLALPRLLSCIFLATSLVFSYHTSASELSIDEGMSRIINAPTTVIEEYSNILQNLSTQTDPKQNDIAIAHLVLSKAYYNVLLAEKALFHAELALQAISDQTNSLLYNQVLVSLSKALELDGQAKKAKPLAEQALRWAVINENEGLTQQAHITVGVCNLTLGAYGDALQNFTQAYQIAKNDSSIVRPKGEISYYLGLVHEYRRNNPEAIKFFQQALDYYETSNDRVSYSDSLYGLARAYKFNGQADQALPLFLQSLAISVEVNDAQGEAYTYKELAGIYIDMEDDEQGHRSLIKALLLFSEANNPFMLAEVNKQLADFANKQGQIPQALQMVDIALEYAQGDSFKSAFISLHYLKATLLAKVGDYEAAYNELMISYKEKNQYDAKQNNEKYDRLRAEFELNQKEDENRLLLSENTLANQNAADKQQQNLILELLLVLFITVALAVFFLYRQSKKAQKQLKFLASTDPLTKIANRRTAFSGLASQMKLATREHYELSVALVDLDYFKKINDELGHPTGDKVLTLFAELAQEQFRSTDLIARIGGEEFLFIFPFTSIEQAQLLIIEFTDIVKEDTELKSLLKNPLTCSVGVVDATRYDNELSTISAADKVMYQAKAFGRDAIMIESSNNTD